MIFIGKELPESEKMFTLIQNPPNEITEAETTVNLNQEENDNL